MTTDASAQETIDGFHLVINALKLNGIDTIFGLPGIPITDLTRMAQTEGMRVISFRHEQHAGNAAAAAGFLTQKPGICPAAPASAKLLISSRATMKKWISSPSPNRYAKPRFAC